MFIMLSIENDIIPQVQDVEDAFEAWKKLQTLYEDSNKTRIVCLKNKLYELTLQEGGLMADHLTNLKDQLSVVGDEKLEEKEFK